MIPLLCEKLVELVYLIFIRVNKNFMDEPATFMAPRNNKYTGLCQYCLITSEGTLFRCIYFPQKHGYFSSAPNLLVKVTASAYTSVLNFVGHLSLWVSWIQCHRPSCLCEYFVGPKFSLVGISQTKYFLSLRFRGSKIFIVGISQVQNCFLWVFRGPTFFSREYFVGAKFFPWIFLGSKIFLVEISWVQNIYRGYLVGPKLSLVVISWFKSFFSWVLCGFKTFSRGYFIGPNFSLS